MIFKRSSHGVQNTAKKMKDIHQLTNDSDDELVHLYSVDKDGVVVISDDNTLVQGFGITNVLSIKKSILDIITPPWLTLCTVLFCIILNCVVLRCVLCRCFTCCIVFLLPFIVLY